MSDIQSRTQGREIPQLESQIGRATSHALASWFPVNSEHLGSVKRKLLDGIYDEDIEALIGDLKVDYSLFMYCVRELLRAASQEPTTTPFQGTAVELIRRSGPLRIKSVLSVDDADISVHRMSDLQPAQAIRFKEVMVSAQVSETLAESYNIEPELAYSCALFRQLGITLIAWNYPHVYSKTLPNTDPKSFDIAISKVLGFTPTMLGLAIAGQWEVSPEIRIAMGDEALAQNTDIVSKEMRAKAAALEQICKVGEAFAHYTASDLPSRTMKGWQDAKDAIFVQLGSAGYKALEQKLAECCKNYIAFAPDFFDVQSVTGTLPEIRPDAESNKFAQNQYIRHLPRVLQSKLELLYSKIQPGVISKDAADLLLKDIIPAAGFSRGAVYLIEIDTGTLQPRLLAGSMTRANLRPLSFRSPASQKDPVVKAYHSNIPVLDSYTAPDGTNRTFIAGVIGHYYKAGVLYVESDAAPNTESGIDSEQAHKLLFKALRQALNDCFGLH